MSIPESADEDYVRGYSIVVESLTAPVIQIAENAGLCGKAVLSEIQRRESPDIGYDALNNEYVYMFEKGIIDPVKVIKNEVMHASSVSSMILTTEASITKLPEQNKLSLQNLMQ